MKKLGRRASRIFHRCTKSKLCTQDSFGCKDRYKPVFIVLRSQLTPIHLFVDADIAEAIYPIYEDLSNVKLFERCVGAFTQNNASYNQLIWKVTPKIVPCGSKVVEIAAYIVAGMFNEGAKSLLYFMSALGLLLGTAAHAYVDKEAAERVMISVARAQGRKKNSSTATPAWTY
ncbi:uncharacterized protein TNIN_499181 [Trichonephila inaurata madagascariensis]|uniref:Uncharacterized protein n=1 Tax=Trichonephila inaurata madagascariensis TaxID=2747483 RepID=A0A8X6WPY3_9ARAC|nr:uncharacterized protein TNIN_499181 [Trichonephila inaurata madagascariensis]